MHSEININNSLVNNVNNDSSVVDASSISMMACQPTTSIMTVDLSSSSQKVKVIEASTPKEKEKISGS